MMKISLDDLAIDRARSCAKRPALASAYLTGYNRLVVEIRQTDSCSA
jgi:hypothetical protein